MDHRCDVFICIRRGERLKRPLARSSEALVEGRAVQGGTLAAACVLARLAELSSSCCCGDDGGRRRGPGLLVSGSARFRRTFPNLQPSQNPLVCALPAGRLPVQASAESGGPDALAAGLGALPSHEEQRAGPHAPRESGERAQESPGRQPSERPRSRATF